MTFSVLFNPFLPVSRWMLRGTLRCSLPSAATQRHPRRPQRKHGPGAGPRLRIPVDMAGLVAGPAVIGPMKSTCGTCASLRSAAKTPRPIFPKTAKAQPASDDGGGPL